jgi:hypothetical protein
VACGVGAGTGDGLEEHCPRTAPSYLSEVDAAINRVVDRHPELVDRDRRAGAGGFWVQDIDGFFEEVVKEIAEGSQLCAVVDARDRGQAQQRVQRAIQVDVVLRLSPERRFVLSRHLLAGVVLSALNVPASRTAGRGPGSSRP